MEQNIGERQRWAWLVAGLSAIVAAETSRYDWIWVLAGGVITTLFYLFLDRKLEDRGLAQILCGTFGWGGKILSAMTLLWTILVLGWTANLADAAFPMVNGFPGLGWILLALAAWGAGKGAGACARCCGALCLFLIVLYGTILGFAVPDIAWRELQPTVEWRYGLQTAGLFLLPAGVWYVPCTRSRKGTAWQMILLLPLSAGVLSAVTTGVLSRELAAVRPVPLYDLTQSISLFGVMERIEPLLSAAMTMGVFALLSSLVCGAKALADQIRPWNGNGWAVCILAGASMFLTKDMPAELVAVGAAAFWLVIPLIALLTAGRRDFRT